MRPTRCAAFFLFAALFAPFAPLAHAAEPTHAVAAPTPAQVQGARELFAAASKDEEGQRWTDALEKLHRVAEVKLTASVRYHTAFCEEKLGQSATALAHYTEARDAAEREHNKDVLDLLKPPFLADLRARVPTLTIEVPAGAIGAEVTLDGRPHPRALWSVAVPLDPGTHRIEAHAPDREPFTRDLALHEREVTVLDVSLPVIAKPVVVPAAVAPPPVARKQATLPSPAPEPAPPPSPSASPSKRPIGAAVGTTLGAVLLAGGGVAAFVLAGNAQSSGASECLTRTTSCDDLRKPVRTWDAVALGAWIGAAALATTAIVLWASPAKAETGGAFRLTASGPTLRLEGSF